MQIRFGTVPLFTLLLTASFSFTTAQAQSHHGPPKTKPGPATPIVGQIDWVKGEVDLIPRGVSRKRLRPGFDGGKWLHARSVLWVPPGSSIRLFILNEAHVLEGPMRFELPNSSSEIMKQIRPVFVIGGGNRAPSNFLISPYNAANVRPQHLELRWKTIDILTSDVATQIEFKLLDRKHSLLWKSPAVAVKAGYLNDTGFNQALEAAQNATDPVRLTLEIAVVGSGKLVATSEDSRVNFYLISHDQQKQVEAQLGKLQKTPGILPLLKYAGVLQEAGLINEVATTFEAAHLRYPLSETIIESLVAAEHAVGSFDESNWFSPHTALVPR